MKTISTAVTRPRSSSGVTSGRIVWRRTTLTMSTEPPGRQREQREPHRLREPEDDHRDAVERDDGQQGASGAPAQRPSGHDDRCAERPDGGRRAQDAEPGGPDLEHVAREDGQQRDRAAEQDGEQVERDRAEQHGRPPHEPDAAEDAREVG